LKRFIRYLYEYEKDKRIRNVGFIKVESGCEETIVHLQAKGFHNREERKLKLYLFYVENDEIVGIFWGERSLTSPVLSWNCGFSVDDTGGQEVYSKICGVLVETGDGRRMAATWDDKCVDVSRMKEFTEAEEERDEEVVQMKVELSPVEEEPSQSEESARPRVQKITRQGISKLPRCEWKLANNKFLIHGYNHFHHLLLIDDENHLKLGVPGIYHIEEAKCANTFGFGEFVPAQELKLSDELEDNPEETFGYWCRPVCRRRKIDADDRREIHEAGY